MPFICIMLAFWGQFCWFSSSDRFFFPKIKFVRKGNAPRYPNDQGQDTDGCVYKNTRALPPRGFLFGLFARFIFIGFRSIIWWVFLGGMAT